MAHFRTFSGFRTFSIGKSPHRTFSGRTGLFPSDFLRFPSDFLHRTFSIGLFPFSDFSHRNFSISDFFHRTSGFFRPDRTFSMIGLFPYFRTFSGEAKHSRAYTHSLEISRSFQPCTWRSLFRTFSGISIECSRTF